MNIPVPLEIMKAYLVNRNDTLASLLLLEYRLRLCDFFFWSKEADGKTEHQGCFSQHLQGFPSPNRSGLDRLLFPGE